MTCNVFGMTLNLAQLNNHCVTTLDKCSVLLRLQLHDAMETCSF